jgi:histidine triad (HIT) family protein
MKSDDIFCKIIAGEIPSHKVYEDDQFFAFLDVNPLNPGHTLLVPKEHYEYLFDMPSELYTALWLKAKEISPAIQRATNAKRIGVVVEGFAVPHVHIHLAPINSPRELDSSNQKPAKPDDLAEMAEKIRALLSS